MANFRCPLLIDRREGIFGQVGLEKKFTCIFPACEKDVKEMEARITYSTT